MGFRAGKAKGPYVGPPPGGSGGASNPWHLVGAITPAFFTTDHSSTDLILAAVPANTVLEAIRAVTTVAFVNPSATYLNVRFGVLGTLDLYTDYYNAMPLDARKLAWVFDENDLAGWNVRIGFLTDGSLDGFSAGSMNIWLKYWTIP